MFALLLRDELLASKKGLNWTRGWDCGGGGGGGKWGSHASHATTEQRTSQPQICVKGRLALKVHPSPSNSLAIRSLSCGGVS
jgi:hypothetical protein